MDKTPIGKTNINERRKLGIETIPEERTLHATVPNLTLNENTFLTYFFKYSNTKSWITNLLNNPQNSSDESTKIIKNNDIKADIAILTAEEVKFFGLLTLSMNLKNTKFACNLLGAKKLFITGSNPKKNTGFVNHFLKLNKLDNDFIDDKIEIFYEAGSSFSS